MILKISLNFKGSHWMNQGARPKYGNSHENSNWIQSTRTLNSAVFSVKKTNVPNKEIFQPTITASTAIEVNGQLVENLPASDLRFLINQSREQSR